MREKTDEVQVQEDSVEEVLEELKQELPDAAPKPPKPRRRRKPRKPTEPETLEMITKREYRLELFEEGDNNVFARQRGLSREGWDWPVIHGFRRHAASGLVADSFLILVASRDLEVPAGEAE